MPTRRGSKAARNSFTCTKRRTPKSAVNRIRASSAQMKGLAREPTMTKLEKFLYTAKAHTTGGRETASRASSPAYQAYQILHVAFVIAPVLAGLDKFFHLLVNWDIYLAPAIANLSPIGGHRLMMVIGVVEIIVGILVAMKPRIGAYVVCAWLLGIA